MAEATTVNMEMTSDRSAITDAGRIVPAGTRVTYIAHVVGGCVRVRLPDGEEVVLNPNVFPQLR